MSGFDTGSADGRVSRWQNGVNQLPEVSTWGGNVVFAPEDGLYHAFYSEMSLGCGLNTWTTNSCVPLVSQRPQRADPSPH